MPKLNHHHIILVFGSGFFLVCLGVFIFLVAPIWINQRTCKQLMEPWPRKPYMEMREIPENSGNWYWCDR